jgi:PAS domain S-box-containing protein
MTPPKILIVEDEALVAASLHQILVANNYAVLSPVATGEEAFQSVLALQPDLVLMDIELLSAMKGTEVAGRIRESFDIPVIYMTAYSDDRRIEEATLTEPYGYLVKPVEPRDLLIAIRMALYKHATDRKLRASEERYRIVADFTADWEYWKAPDGKLLYISPSCERITGYSAQEFLEKPDLIETIVHPDDRSLFDRNREEIQKDRDSSAIREIEFRIIRKDGQLGWVGHTGRSVFGKNGAQLGIRVSNRDIAARKRAEDSLRSAKEIFEGMVNGLTDIVGLQKPDHTVLRYNKAGYEALGMTPEQVSGKKCFELIGRTRLCEVCATTKALHTKRMETVERWVPEIGRYFECTSNPILDEKGNVSLIIERLHDITERKRSEKLLRESQEKFYRAFHDNSVAMSLSSFQEGRYLDVNAEFLRLAERTREEIIGHTAVELGIWRPEQRQVVIRQIEEQGAAHNLELEIRAKSGRVLTLIWSAVKLVVNDEPCLLVSAQNITERKQTEIALAESVQKYREMSDLLPEPLFECDMAGNITYVNQSALERFRYRVDDLAGGLNIYQMIVPEEVERAKQHMVTSLATGRGVDGREYMARRKDGTTFPVMIYTAIMSRDGRFVGFRGILVDISERKRAELERQKMLEQLMQSQKMEAIGQLAGGIAHDFNNTLGSIIGYAELARARVAKDDADSEHYLKGICLAAGRSKDLIKQLLLHCRNRSSSEEDLLLTSVIRESLKMIRSVLPPDIRLSFSLPDEPLIVRGDGPQLHQALINLCTNAIYAMKGREGMLDVNLSLYELSAEEAIRSDGTRVPGRYAKLTVSDNGVGISRENVGKIFDPFFTTKPPGEGTGLGLAMVYGVVKRHRGRIDVESVVGQGTTFTLLLPLASASTEYPREDVPVKAMPRGSGELLLVVDDDAAMAETIVRRLELLHYRAEVCHSGQSALERIRKESGRYDAVITDHIMPFLMGSDLIQLAHEVRPDLPFILCTGYMDRLSPEHAADIGASAYLEKPVTMELLAETLHGILHRGARDGYGYDSDH